jgi:hypothetical protein
MVIVIEGGFESKRGRWPLLKAVKNQGCQNLKNFLPSDRFVMNVAARWDLFRKDMSAETFAT